MISGNPRSLERKLSSESVKDNVLLVDGSDTNTKRFKLMKVPSYVKEYRRFQRSELEVGNMLKKGACCSFWYAVVVQNMKPVMVKALYPDPDLDPDDFKVKKSCEKVDVIKKEEEILSMLPPHPNVNGFYGMTEDMRVLVLEEVRTDLATVLHLTEHLIPITILKWTRDILLGLAHIHGTQVVHQDISPNNICITSQYRAQISEFSKSCRLERQEQLQNKQRIGTLSYRAPELIMGAKTYNNKAKIDCWSVGIVILEMLLGDCPVSGLVTDVCTCHNPFHSNFNFDQLKMIFKLVGTPTDETFLTKLDCFAHFSSWKVYRRGLKQKVWEACILDHKPQHGFFSRKTAKESIEKSSGDDPITLEELKAYSVI
ncbi:hypothetical protein GUITHDRAFT_111188 [Guillardia theta CCMP2712]|uniref:non-specific serine/threonine protein kinase n=1 Tax=Guillardia theta (strain CCMP2712) TaxID=905079 RepID=L1J2S4_GUITC|nr:hypothetical protein GUITHDRAFT_111188 [Guillardia theta CCMP2712]EKX42818.1 hypothetical protein GUITHDRAFT_111188 [Guillardia theta CCMP2712]|eukprot:XP_005829798.1 hypothetical protein GUITHDRAFT_111188 [Guillardia theta CCMP2712]